MTIDIVTTNDYWWQWLLTITHLVICYVIIVMNGMVVIFLFVMTMIINKKHPVKWWEKLGLIAGNVQGLPNVGSIVKVVLI